MFSRLRPYRIKVYGRTSGKVVFFFCPFGIRRWQFRLPFAPIGYLRRAGYQVVCYDFSSSVPWWHAQTIVRVLEEIYTDVEKRATAYQQQGVKDFSAFGVSMGTIFAAYCTAHIPAIQKVVLNLCYADVPQTIIDFPRMILAPNRASQRMVKRAGGEADLRALLDKFSPLNFADKLAKKRVLLYLGRNDRIMRYANTSQLREALRQHGAELYYLENPRFDHYFNALINNLRAKTFMTFLEENRRK